MVIDWADLIDEDEDFCEEFQRIYNNNEVQEADDYTSEIRDHTYLNMEVALPHEDTGPTFAKVTKRLKDANGIPIVTANENPILDSYLYEVEYLDRHKASLSANAIATNIFAQIDKQGNRMLLYNAIIDYPVNGTKVQPDYAFISSTNGGKCRKKTTRG